MRAWLTDWFRTAAALWYWNIRKTIFVWRRGRGACPCQNPSDSGRAFETGCEAAAFWHSPARFSRRVCPLLVRTAERGWVCSVAAENVRPFWGRTVRFYAVALLALFLTAGLAGYGVLRAVGFNASLRQVLWPPAWTELRQVRAQFFVVKGEKLLAAGKVREAVLALNVARDADPQNYAIGLTMARFYSAWRPDLVDELYRNLLREHPERQVETSRAWLQSLLARVDLAGVAELAQARLAAEPAQAGVWANALLTAARLSQRPESIARAAKAGAHAAVRRLLELEMRVRESSVAEARMLLLRAPAERDFAYGNYYRVQRLISLGEGNEALTLLREIGGTLSGRDVVRLALAAHATAGNTAALAREAAVLLAPDSPNGVAGLDVLALHLLQFPDRKLLDACVAALPHMPAEPAAMRYEAVVALYCAAAAQGEREALPGLGDELLRQGETTRAVLTRMDELLSRRTKEWPVQSLLTLIRPLPLELNYALLESFYGQRR